MDLTKIAAPSAEAIADAREHVAYIGKLLFERHLTDAGGGNVSMRVGNLICVSPRYSGTKRQWQLKPEDVLVVDFDRHILEGDGALSREANAHFSMHKEFGDYGTAVIHAHARNLLVFAMLEMAMPPVLEATRKFGITPVVNYAPAHSEELANNIINAIRGREAQITKHAAGVIAPWHGVFLIGKDLDAAFDAVERFDTNAYLIMMGQMLVGREAQEAKVRRMEEIISKYEG